MFYTAILRSFEPVWNRNTVFDHSMPFAFPSGSDTGSNLTEVGKRMVKVCNRICIAIDLAHTTEKGFWSFAKQSEQPLIFSHSNVHTITPISCNLTEKQVAAVRESNGLVGLNFAVTMPHNNSAKNDATPLPDMIGHIDGMALYSNFRGATMSAKIDDATGLQKIVEALQKAGYCGVVLAKIYRENLLITSRSS